MEFHLTPELEEFVNEGQSGRGHSTSEVVADALGLLAGHAKVRAARLRSSTRN